MMKKEEVRAWNRTIRQWAWYEKHPLARKEDYFAAYPKIKKPLHSLCFLCDLYRFRICKDCPLAEQGLWCVKNTNRFQKTAPYILWSEALYDGNKASYINEARIIKEAVMKWKEDHK